MSTSGLLDRSLHPNENLLSKHTSSYLAERRLSMGIAYAYGNIHHDQCNTLFFNAKIARVPLRLVREYGIFPPNWKRTISWTRPPLLCGPRLQYRILRLSSTLADAETLEGIHILEAKATWPRRPCRQLRISRIGHVMIESRCRVFGTLEVRVGTIMCKWHFFCGPSLHHSYKLLLIRGRLSQ